MYDNLLAVNKYSKLPAKFLSGTLTVIEKMGFLSFCYFSLEQLLIILNFVPLTAFSDKSFKNFRSIRDNDFEISHEHTEQSAENRGVPPSFFRTQ